MAPRQKGKELRHFRRALPLALAFSMAMGAVALAADQVVTDTEPLITTSITGTLNLGTVAPGASLSPPVGFVLKCESKSHVDAGQTVVLTYTTSGSGISPAGGSLSAQDGSLGPIPASWADDTTGAGQTNCTNAHVDLRSATNATVTITAPTSPGTYTATARWLTSLTPIGNGDSNAVNNAVTANFTFTVAAANSAPVVAANNALVTVNEGSLAGMTGTWSDSNPGDTVTLSASVGTVVKSGNNASGTWSWSYTPDDGPVDSQTVTVTADDGTDTGSATFGLIVDNVAPTATLGNDGPIDEGGSATVSFSGASDPSAADTAAGFRYAFSCTNSPGSLPIAYSAAGTDSSATCPFDDGPANKTVVGRIFDKDNGYRDYTTTVVVNNVAPTATRNSGSSVTALSGLAVNFNFSATDPSSADTTAGFEWRFDDGKGGGYGPYWTPAQTADFVPSATYASCGTYTVTAQAKDKDGGQSNEPSATVNVFNGDFHGAIVPATRNLVQKGRVVPVQVRIGCGGVAQTGLSPVIMLVAGDADPNTDSSDPAVLTATTVSAADTTGFMRPTDTGYLYNLQIPSNATAGSKYTILVRPWGSGATMKALIEIRK